MRFLYGYAERHPNEQCAISPADPSRTLCGRTVAFLPAHDSDYTPTTLHDVCRDRIFGPVKPAPKPPKPQAESGTCPVCGGTVNIQGGLVAGHGEFIVQAGEPVESDTRCDGAGLAPEAES